MAAEASTEEAAVSKARDEEIPPQLAFNPACPSQPSGPSRVTQPNFLTPKCYQKNSLLRSDLLLELGAYHVILALLHLALGSYLLWNVQNLHLVVLKTWYPFWGAASFLLSGMLVISVQRLSKKFVISCGIANAVSFLCALAGLTVIVKDLFLESPFQSPIWRTYPNSTVHIQRLELALLCFTFLELVLPTSLAAITHVEHYQSVKGDNLSLVPDMPLEPREMLMSPPPSYEEATAPNSVEVTAPNSVEATAPNSVEATAPNSVEATAPNSVEATAPNSVEATAPNSVEATAPNSVEATAPNSVEVTAPNSVEATAPNSVEVTAPNSVEATAPNSVEVTAPNYVEATAPNSVEATAPNSVEATAPSSEEDATQDEKKPR